MAKTTVAPALVNDFQQAGSASDENSGGQITGQAELTAPAAKPRVVYFCAEWCPPCKLMKKAIGVARQRFGCKVDFIGIDIDEPGNRGLLSRYNIQSVPTLYFIGSDGTTVFSTLGYSGNDFFYRGVQELIKLDRLSKTSSANTEAHGSYKL